VVATSPCRWLVSTSQRITLFLSAVLLPPGASIVVYDGGSAYVGGDPGAGVGDGDRVDANGVAPPRRPVLLELNASALYVQPVVSTGTQLLVEILLGPDAGREGVSFDATYHSGRCEGEVVLPATSGVITDGSDTAATQSSHTGLNCSWLIQPTVDDTTNVSGLVLIFDRLHTRTWYSERYPSRAWTYIDIRVTSIDEAGVETQLFFRDSSTTFVPRYIEARGRAFRVSYRSRDGEYSTTSTGFEARYYALYEGSGCPDTALPLTESSGRFGEPQGYPHEVSATSPCRWLISTSQQITLFLSAVRLPAGASIVVYDGGSAYVGGDPGAGVGDTQSPDETGVTLPPTPSETVPHET